MAHFFDGLPTEDRSNLHGFSGNRIDRRSENRDDDSVPAALADPECLRVNRNQGAGTRILIDRLLGRE